jgi:N6-L-threonylcarbamoyladenine synthase
LHEKNYDFSFSGLKTAILREVTHQRHPALDAGSMDSRLRGNDNNLSQNVVNNICRGLQDAIIDVLVSKTLKAAEEYNVQSILLSGGVAANQTLRDEFIVRGSSFEIFVPQKSLCTDNAAMIGAAAVFQNKTVSWKEVAANPELYFD